MNPSHREVLTPPSPSREPSFGLVLLLSAATGLAVGSQYYNQPLLGLIANDFGVGANASLIATTTQIGYALGLILLVPLGDSADRRLLILLQCLGLALAMGCASVAPGLYSLAMISVLIGVFATIAQQIIPLAAELASPRSRERILATVTSALLVGVLLARTISGLVGAWFGWRAMFIVGAVIAVLMLVCLATGLPSRRPESRESYLALLASLFIVARDHAVLRKATLTQSLLFFGFSAFWTILALLLQGPSFGLSSGAAGMYGLLALAGVVIAPLGIRIAGKNSPLGAIRLGSITVAVSFLLMIPMVSLVGLGIGTVLMVTGVQMSLISNQSIIFAIAGSARGRFNTVFMASQFAFGAVGSGAANIAWKTGGWTALMTMSAIAAGLAIFLQFKRKQEL
ncbi:TPA: MFS transporter [Burkholderia aenigmatica]|uniref:MFS transporter n=1 Tax=Burkholderia sp. AU45251 TaxID=3059204 RepID=UPI002656650F|nr:MFS transporter [Burkholderia sp. AU45251]HDR9482947.1 MFS transporter [Burkholderia aenigmatica]MDN7515811.1 MFS transporter [Burkholderia sp. AU45251]HDR9488482.1 MFS transporter [Burkholderia aenigmatica]HDR9513894.1 MFS transporter [Burkholderia aenigmatica]HDR9520662.1 MFS transporter [Burkholderia aenigmatica]